MLAVAAVTKWTCHSTVGVFNGRRWLLVWEDNIYMMHWHCKPIFSASGAWPTINHGVCSIQSWGAAAVGFLSQCIVLRAPLCALKFHRCALLISPSLSGFHLTVEAFSCVVPETPEPQVVEDVVISYSLVMINTALLFKKLKHHLMNS